MQDVHAAPARPKSAYYRAMLKIEHLAKFLDQVEQFRPTVSLIGGEPMVHPRIEEIISEIKKRGLSLSLLTNAHKLEEKAEFLLQANDIFRLYPGVGGTIAGPEVYLFIGSGGDIMAQVLVWNK